MKFVIYHAKNNAVGFVGMFQISLNTSLIVNIQLLLLSHVYSET